MQMYIATRIGFWSHIPQNAGKILKMALRTARVLCTDSLKLAKSYSYDLIQLFVIQDHVLKEYLCMLNPTAFL